MRAFLYFILVLAFCGHSFARGENEFSPGQRRHIDSFAYIFVGGFGNEFARSHYFAIEKSTLHEIGARDVERFFPSSFRSAEGNLESVRDKIVETYNRTGKPVMVVGHSKGALETLATLITFPELVTTGMVANVVLAQGPIDGNTLLDQSGFWGRTLARIFSIAPSFRSLRSAEIRALISDRLAGQEISSDLAAVGRSIRYVISSKEVKESGRALRISSMLSKHQVPNDGLVAKRDMYIAGFGTVLLDVNMDHLEKLLGRNVPFLVDNVDEGKVREFTIDLIRSLFRSRGPDRGEFKTLTELKKIEKIGPSSCEQNFLSL